MCKERTFGGRFGEGLRACPTKGACRVFRDESRMQSDAVESLSVNELLEGYSCSSAGRSTRCETKSEQEVSLLAMLLTSTESRLMRGKRLARSVGPLSTNEYWF